MLEWISRLPHVREVWSSNSGLATSYAALQTIRHHFNIYANIAVFFGDISL